VNGLLFGQDEVVARWAFTTHNFFPMQADMAIGIIAPPGHLVGAAIYQNFNGYNVDLAYYGHNTLTVGIIRTLARTTLAKFNPSRVTFLTSKKNRNIIRWLPKIGCKLEGVARCYYGSADNTRNTAMRFVLYRDALERLAGTRKVSPCLAPHRPAIILPESISSALRH
jgi:hypothetical protein